MVWHSLLPHGPAPNVGTRPRISAYVSMVPEEPLGLHLGHDEPMVGPGDDDDDGSLSAWLRTSAGIPRRSSIDAAFYQEAAGLMNQWSSLTDLGACFAFMHVSVGIVVFYVVVDITGGAPGRRSFGDDSGPPRYDPRLDVTAAAARLSSTYLAEGQQPPPLQQAAAARSATGRAQVPPLSPSVLLDGMDELLLDTAGLGELPLLTPSLSSLFTPSLASFGLPHAVPVGPDAKTDLTLPSAPLHAPAPGLTEL